MELNPLEEGNYQKTIMPSIDKTLHFSIGRHLSNSSRVFFFLASRTDASSRSKQRSTLLLRPAPSTSDQQLRTSFRNILGTKPDRLQSTSIDNLMLNKLRNDLEKLPEDRCMEEFEDISVENFASALLKGYGWVEGRGIGKNAKEDVKVVEYKKRTGKEGLGFVNDIPIPPTKKETNERKDSGNGSGSGSGGDGRRGRSKEEVKVRHGGERRSKDRSQSKRSESHERQEITKTSISTPCSKSWLNSHIRVRIISKKVKGGRLYLQKGEVVDVVGPTTCDISMDNSRELVQGVEQEFLETALPRRGGPVLVLYGRHKGVYGSLMEKDNENETAVVRDQDTHGLINVKLEQIAEYLGDPDDIGY